MADEATNMATSSGSSNDSSESTAAAAAAEGDSLEAYYSGENQRYKVLFEFILVSV